MKEAIWLAGLEVFFHTAFRSLRLIGPDRYTEEHFSGLLLEVGAETSFHREIIENASSSFGLPKAVFKRKS